MRWQPSTWERQQHSYLSAEAALDGRLIVRAVPGFRRPLCLFTTLPQDTEQIAALYARRWQIELDLRAWKRTMRMHQLRGRSVEAVEKELLVAVVAYGLVRAFMAAAASRAQLSPRRLSFTRCYGWLDLMAARLCNGSASERSQAFQQTLAWMAQSKLPVRKKPRSYPYTIWSHRTHFPIRRVSLPNGKSK